MDLEIIPIEGVGPIKFGMSPEAVRSIIGGEYRSFLKTPKSVFPCDSFRDEGIICFYDANACLEAIEFMRRSQPHLYGHEFIGHTVEDVRTFIAGLDDNVEINSDGAISHRLGVGVYAPLAKSNPRAIVESVIAFRQGYYASVV